MTRMTQPLRPRPQPNRGPNAGLAPTAASGPTDSGPTIRPYDGRFDRDPSMRPVTPTVPFYVRPPQSSPFPDITQSPQSPGSLRPPGGGSPYGRGSGGGGGGGPAPAGIDQATYDRWLKAQQGNRPQQVTYDDYTYRDYQWQDLELPDYVAPTMAEREFYEWDGAQYDTARQGVSTGIDQARQAAGGALDRSAAAYAGAGNPFTGRQFAQSQGIDPRLQASMAAYGGQSGANEALGEGLANDAAMGSIYDLLGRSTDQFNTNMVNSVSGDKAQMQERMGMAETTMNLQINMAEQQSLAQYEKEKFAFGEAEAQRRHQERIQEAMINAQIDRQEAEANNAGRNQVGMSNNAGRNQAGMANNTGRNNASQANTLMQNQYDQQQLQTALELWMAGMNGAGTQTLDLSGEF